MVSNSFCLQQFLLWVSSPLPWLWICLTLQISEWQWPCDYRMLMDPREVIDFQLAQLLLLVRMGVMTSKLFNIWFEPLFLMLYPLGLHWASIPVKHVRACVASATPLLLVFHFFPSKSTQSGIRPYTPTSLPPFLHSRPVSSFDVPSICLADSQYWAVASSWHVFPQISSQGSPSPPFSHIIRKYFMFNYLSCCRVQLPSTSAFWSITCPLSTSLFFS